MLTYAEIMNIVIGYIGGSGGYLGEDYPGRFSYKSHKEFYPSYCGLDIDPDQYEGTTRDRFIKILQLQDSKNQAKILRGILAKYPFDKFTENQQSIKKKCYEDIQNSIKKLEGEPYVEEPKLTITSEVVQKAIQDAEILIQENGATSGIDRIHTALHGYLKEICRNEGITLSLENPTINNLFKAIRNSPKFQIDSNRHQDVEKIINSMANIFDALNPIRNNASVAHPNRYLLAEPEAILVINSARTLLNYLNSKFND